jgi:hypothetical protein
VAVPRWFEARESSRRSAATTPAATALADRKMNEARSAVGEQLREPSLGLADHAHRAVQREQRGQIRRQVRLIWRVPSRLRS